ncbi:hypothetical protein P3T76_000591 [Phytophthora citrophthora]|uniref:Uncharacterized protein n=1 Tax=Phytophthora citrophthora TaxID=4793 RepID=A0AAD9H2C4_9STRA|nr:hypothetical protein P3T76_000591 [Phytophthora citrophthora]
MDEMAKMLETYAGGLQQSFESVFERVGQSLTQSAQVMRMMNEVMETAMMQNLLVSSTFDRNGTLLIDVENRSQIMLGRMKISAQLHTSETSFFSTTLELLAAGQLVQLQASVQDLIGPVTGFIELECISPGTQQPLTKRTPFHVFFFQGGTFQAVQSGQEGAVPDASEVAAMSDNISLTRVREVLDLSPIDGILTFQQGRYRFVPTQLSDTIFYLSVEESEDGENPYKVIVNCAGSAASAQDRQLQCQRVIQEMEMVDN